MADSGGASSSSSRKKTSTMKRVDAPSVRNSAAEDMPPGRVTTDSVGRMSYALVGSPMDDRVLVQKQNSGDAKKKGRKIVEQDHSDDDEKDFPACTAFIFVERFLDCCGVCVESNWINFDFQMSGIRICRPSQKFL